VHLSGSITCPEAASACPGVVLIGGSGPSDRHNDGFFDELRAQLTAWGDYDPRGDLARLMTPTLAILGENDPLVPVRASAERYETTAASTGRLQETLIFPEADHRLRVTAGFAPGYLTRLSAWCQGPGAPPQPR
jgi:fermentation-respiration switch protein FrsA (DUF1100 family)